jgi:uncharacterized protein
MATRESNIDTIKQGYAAFGTGDLATLEAMFAPHAVWHEPGSSPISGSYKGWAEVSGLFVNYAVLSGGTFKAELDDVLASDTRAFSIARVSGARNGRRLDQGDHVLFEIGPDDRITEARVLYHDQAAVDAFWA